MKPIPKRNRDLLRYVRKKKLIRSLLALIWIGILISGVLMYNHSHRAYSVHTPITGWKFVLLCVAATVSGILIFRLPKLFLDRSFEGIVERSGLSHSYSRSADPGSAEYNFRLNTVLRIRTPDGKHKKIRFEEKPGFFLYYHEGTRVRHFPGLPYPLADISESRADLLNSDTHGDRPLGSYLCVACGRLRQAPDVCDRCGLSIIDPKEIFEEKNMKQP